VVRAGLQHACLSSTYDRATSMYVLLEIDVERVWVRNESERLIYLRA
jgi:hypothetical protein